MNSDLTGPADTSLMRIVHDGLRRDLARAQHALATAPYPEDDQRAAIASHLGWLTDFLHRHHEAEDEGLYPLVRRRSPAAAALLDLMDEDHKRIGPAMTGLASAAAAYADSAEAREQALRALDELSGLLLPHLDREENQMMPLVSAAITEAEWQQWDQEYNVKPLRPLPLADTGLWILDGLNPADRAEVTALVPPVPRWIITNLLSGRYRRAAYRRWQLPEHSGRKAPQSGQAEVTTTAAPGAVWAVLADVTRVGEWSHECHGAVWLDGAAAAAVGARFRGRNKAGRVRWSRPCTIEACEPPRELVYRTKGLVFGDATEWRFVLEPSSEGGTLIRQSYRVLTLPVWADRLLWVMVPAHHDRLAALQADLGRLAAIAEARPARPARPHQPSVS
jgi:hemerythrin-like domain-containing protein/uncharacterized protein YndB with AHSA1/START domain